VAKKTALEAALEGKRARIDPRRILVGAGAVLAIIAALACFAQAWQGWREAAAHVALQGMRDAVVAELEGFIASRQEALKTALEDAQLRADLAPGDEVGRDRAAVRLKELLPELERVEFYGGELYELLTRDLEDFGYARANILADARARNGIAPAQVHRDQAERNFLALAQAVREGELPIAYAYVWLPPGPTIAPDTPIAPEAGTLEIRQGVRGFTELKRYSGVGSYVNFEAEVRPVANSILTVAISRGELFKLPLFGQLDHWLVLGLGVGLLLLAALLFGQRARMAGVESVASRLLDRVAPKKAEEEGEIMPVGPAKPAPTTAAASSPAPTAATAAAAASGKSAAAKALAIDRSIFRAYDIRGVVGQSLHNDTARMIGLAVGSVLRERGLKEIVIGRDGRLSGPDLVAELIRGLRATGCDVLDIGQVPTPVVYFATYHLNAGSGIAVTGSHNPSNYNGFKIVVGGETLAEDAIQDLYRRISEGRYATGSGGLQVMDVFQDYLDRISGDVQVERRLKVVVDAGNGVAGGVAPQVLEAIGCDVVPLYCEVDGTFPNHHPDPTDPHNLEDLILSVKRLKADVGLAFDGDGDRLGVVTASGEIIYPDRVLMLFAIDVLNRNPGATVIYDVKCTGHLQDIVLRNGGSPIMWKTGHSLMKAKLREEDAALAGEMSGHFFFRERWYGFDDAIYAAARLCEILGASERAPQELFDELPKGVSTPELKVEMQEGQPHDFIARFRDRSNFPSARVSTIDGVRADYPDGWGLVRASNTTPSLVLRFDADNAEALERIKTTFREQMRAIEKDIALPF
jgi:phosphomannomutase/phosphoglucomutase